MSDKISVGIHPALMRESVAPEDVDSWLAFVVNELAPWVNFSAITPEELLSRPGEGAEQFCGYITGTPSTGVAQAALAELRHRLSWLPLAALETLSDTAQRENFVQRIYTLYELNQLSRSGLTRGKIIAFHSRYKLLLLAHSQPDYRAIGPFVATLDRQRSLEGFFIEYRQRLMALLSHQATRSNHTNALMHIQGYFRRYLNAEQRQALSAVIDSYRRGAEPLQTPVALLKRYLAEYPAPYLEQQRYFEPYSEALRRHHGD